MSNFKPIGSVADAIMANLERQIKNRIDRCDMRADSALDVTRERVQRMKDYIRYEYEAERAQILAGKQGAWERIESGEYLK